MIAATAEPPPFSLWDYDLWANRQWWPTVGGDMAAMASEVATFDSPEDPRERAHAIFCHLIRAQRIWLRRCGVEVQAESVGEEWLDVLNRAWKREMQKHDATDIIAYEHPIFGSVRLPFGDIVQQVLNHGTYHRGQLREIAETNGWDFPETDFIYWRMQTRS